MININDAKNYKPCRKKIYEIFVCKPPIGTCVINKLEQADVVRQCNSKTFFTAEEMQKMSVSNPQMYNFLKANAYIVDSNKRYVLSGILGEMWTIDEAKLCARYQLTDGTNLTPQAILHRSYYCTKIQSEGNVKFVPTGKTLEAHIKEDNSNMQEDCICSVMTWHKVKTKPDMSSGFAMLVPKKEKVQVKTSWGSILTANLAGVEHGKGDFLVCGVTPQGKPDLNNRWIVNGVIFGATYNNQGWQDSLDAKHCIDSSSLQRPKDLFSNSGDVLEKEVLNPDLYNFIGGLAQKCANTQHSELPMKVSKSNDNPNEIIIDCKTILDYGKKNSTEKFKVSSVRTIIRVFKNNKVVFTNYLANDDAVKTARSFRFEIPNNRPVSDTEVIDINEVKSYLVNNAETVFGLCGYVKEVGVKNSFHHLAPLEKTDYDGIRDYTMTSGTVNRLCRGIEYEGEKKGEGRASGIRIINNLDNYFDKVVTSRPVKIFRGEACDDRFYKFSTFENVEGYTSVNTAYSSTSLNMQSTPMFASMGKRNGQPVTEGVIYAIDLPVGTRAGYVHNVAGRGEQFEIILDRCYDIKVNKTLLMFKDNSGHTFKVVSASLVPHIANGSLDVNKSDALCNRGILNYDYRGKVSFEKEYNSGILHEAFNKIRERGFSDVQWQDAFDSSKDKGAQFLDRQYEVQDSIVLRTNNPDNPDKTLDYAFTLADNSLIIHKIIADKSVQQDHHRAKGLRWSQYGLNVLKYSYEDKDRKVINGASSNNFDIDAYDNIDRRQILHLKEVTADEIASKIINYAKTHKNICLLPLIDVARYFDTCFVQVIENEGYELMRTLRVERKVEQGKESDPQAGYVPLKYQITGDNDDHLVISIKFDRDKESGKLQVTYKGRSENTKVDECKSITYSIFNDGAMTKLAEDIIYTFAKKMHLSKARKFDKLINYFCYQTGCRQVRCKQEENSFKEYKVWSADGKSYMNISITKDDVELYTVSVQDNGVFLPPYSMDTSKPIHVLYREFGEHLVNNMV